VPLISPIAKTGDDGSDDREDDGDGKSAGMVLRSSG